MKRRSSRDVTKEPEPKEREVWSSRLAFYFASIGAAVGFGNVWRFPGLSVEYGGGAFFVPYLLALALIGIPLAILEIGFGQYFQTGDIGVFGSFHPRLRGVGVASLACGFILSAYYLVLIAWVINAFFDSFSDDAPWTEPDLNGDEAVAYFYNNIIGMSTVTDPDLRPSRIVWKNVGYTAFVWSMLFLVKVFGLRATGRVTYFTMGLPLVLLFVFLVRGATLDGASEGVYAYVGVWDLSVLRERGEVWSVACSQIFFSISLTFGILTSYGSHCKRDEPVFLNSCVIAISNSLFSIISGFGIFCALGHLASIQGVDVTDLEISGFSLVFGTWPVVLGTLPAGILWVRLLFFDLFLLGIDSALAFVESFLTVLQDTVYFKDVPRYKLLMGIIMPNFLLSLLFCTDAGLFFLDVFDFYINFVLLLVGFLETFGAAWAYGILDMYQNIGVPATLAFMIGNFFPVLLACCLWFGLQNGSEVWAGFIALFGGWLAGAIVTDYFLRQRVAQEPERWTRNSIWWECSFGNIERLRTRIQPVVGWIPFEWAILMKYFIPQVLIILFVNLCASENGAGKYGEYSIRPYQILGLLTFVFAIFVFFVGVVVPEVYEPLALPQTKLIEDDDEGSADRTSEDPEFSPETRK